MYRVIRELIPYLEKDELPALVRLEVSEYARRPKGEPIARGELDESRDAINDLQAAVKAGDREKAAVLMGSIYANAGSESLARKLLLLGSGYLDRSLGHSVSCTVFIFLEMIERQDHYPWPAIATLADYYYKGQFQEISEIKDSSAFLSDEAMLPHLLRAASGRGIVNLHHTITIYAMERVRHFFPAREYNQLIASWVAFMGNKQPEPVDMKPAGSSPVLDYTPFFETFSNLDAKRTLQLLVEMMGTDKGRTMMGRYLIRGVCDLYQGDYDPHYITGLGSALWVVNGYWKQRQIAVNALYQYLDYFFAGVG
jgi:hypothetical protein